MGLETRTDRGLSDFLGPMIDGVAKGLKDVLNIRERAKAVRHAKQRGMDVEDYLQNKHKDQAARCGKTVHEYLREQQDNRRQKYGVDGKTKQCRKGDSTDSSDDSADSGDEKK